MKTQIICLQNIQDRCLIFKNFRLLLYPKLLTSLDQKVNSHGFDSALLEILLTLFIFIVSYL